MRTQVNKFVQKGIVLAGGTGSRLFPVTATVNKQLLPVYDKPMIYYPISTLMLSGIRDILLITRPSDIDNFKQLLGNGHQWGINIDYIIQPSPDGLAQAFTIGREFINGQPISLILGDNIFFGHNLPNLLINARTLEKGAKLFAYRVKDPENYGVICFDDLFNVLEIEEKPKKASSNYAVTGLYFYDGEVCNIARDLEPSSRGELEITDINNFYLKENLLSVQIMGRGFSWLDTGTTGSLLEASNFIGTIQRRQGLQICCPEEISFRSGWIDKEQLSAIARGMQSNDYGQYLLSLINNFED